jgi:hypothetical protein
MTRSLSSSHAVTSSTQHLFLLVVVPGCLSAHISACASVPGPSLGGSSSSPTPGGRERATDADAVPTAPTATIWPDGMAGIWTGKFLGSECLNSTSTVRQLLLLVVDVCRGCASCGGRRASGNRLRSEFCLPHFTL